LCLVFGVLCLVFGVWYFVFGVWYFVFGILCIVFGVAFLEFSAFLYLYLAAPSNPGTLGASSPFVYTITADAASSMVVIPWRIFFAASSLSVFSFPS